MDGIYVIRTNVPAEALSSQKVVGHYKGLSDVERAFRSLKSVDLKVRPIYHYLADRVRAHVFLCMLAYYVEWHMRRELSPLLFDDDEAQAADAARSSIVSPAQRSGPSQAQRMPPRSPLITYPCTAFKLLLKDLATLTLNEVHVGAQNLRLLANTTPVQLRAFPITPGLPVFEAVPSRRHRKIAVTSIIAVDYRKLHKRSSD